MWRINQTILAILLTSVVVHAAPPEPPPDISQGKDGHLVYVTDKNGDRVPDYSYAGYMAGEVAIPDVPVRVVVSPADSDATSLIQSAIDRVAQMQPDDHGFRGAVLLKPGRYEILGQLKINTSGVFLRGSGMHENGTVLVAAGQDRRTLINISGKNDQKLNPTTHPIADKYVPVNASQFRVQNPTALKVHDGIQITRACTADWIRSINMDNFGGDRHGGGWKPGSRELIWDRTITAIDGDTITFDAPITASIDQNFGGGSLASYTWPGRITQVGVENLRCESSINPSNRKDEDHAWMAITFDNAADAWVRQVTVEHFASSAVSISDTCKRITVEDVKSLAPVSEIAGYRRHTFFTSGQQTLFQRCYAEKGRHDFSVGFCAAGPNAFVQCSADEALDDSGPIDSLAAGVLYDDVRIDGNAITLADRRYNAAGAGWNAINSFLWQCNASVIRCFDVPGAKNWAYGCWGSFDGNGEWEQSNESIKPVSLYYAQLTDRMTAEVAKRADIMMIPSDASSSPTPEQAAALIAASVNPAPRMQDWIDNAPRRRPIPTDPADAVEVDKAPAAPTSQPAQQRIEIVNGWITINGKVPAGGKQDIMWWRGGVRPDDLAQNTPCVTRFVPGRVGRGLTDDLDQLSDDMLASGKVALEHHYALWYDRRDDDHERVRRLNGDAWPPFYELPFARSGGDDLAWDGLSKYDLTKYNPWYFGRLKSFADLCDQKGLVLLNEHFFQHNIIEAGAHWASCPWRSANNVNNTGFPEPPPYAGDKRVFMAEQFYDVNNSTRREIYAAYIRKCLDNFAGNSNVIHLTSAEFTGPLPFTKFWLDTIAQWQRDSGKKAIIGLSATKDVQDAILKDSERSKLISVINIEYWWYQTDGKLYAPEGGKNLAPRQWQRVLKPKGSSFEQVARAVREYRQKYPNKAVIYSADGENQGAAVLLGGGSLPNIRGKLDPKLAEALPKMTPLELNGKPVLGIADTMYLTDSNEPVDGYESHRIDQHLVWLTRK